MKVVVMMMTTAMTTVIIIIKKRRWWWRRRRRKDNDNDDDDDNNGCKNNGDDKEINNNDFCGKYWQRMELRPTGKEKSEMCCFGSTGVRYRSVQQWCCTLVVAVSPYCVVKTVTIGYSRTTACVSYS